MSTINAQEWLAELERVSQPQQIGDTGFRTTREISAALNYNEARVKEMLRRAKAVGRLQVGREHRPSLIGMALVPVYRVVSAE